MDIIEKKRVLAFKKVALSEMIDGVLQLIFDAQRRKDGVCESYLMRINKIIGEAMVDDDARTA